MQLPEIEAAIRANGHELVEIRQISQGASRRRNDDGHRKRTVRWRGTSASGAGPTTR